MFSDVAVATGIPIILESIFFSIWLWLGAIFNHPLDRVIFAFSIIQNFSLQKLTIALCKSHDRGNSAGAVGPQIAIFKVTFRFQTLKMNHRIRKFKIHGEQLKILHI